VVLVHEVTRDPQLSLVRRLSAMLIAISACGSSDAASANSSNRTVRPPTPSDVQELAPASAPKTLSKETSGPSPERVEVDNVVLELRGCSLTIIAHGAAPQTTRVDLPSGCAFGRIADGTAQVRRTKQGATLLVISSSPDPMHPGDCITRARAVVVTEHGEVNISRKEKTWASCGVVGPFDEPMFIVLARSIAKP